MSSNLAPYLRYSALENKLLWTSSSSSAILEGREDLQVSLKVKGTAGFGIEHFTDYQLSVTVTNLSGAKGFEIPLPPIFSEDLPDYTLTPGTP